MLKKSISFLHLEKCQVFEGRRVTLFPDLGAFEKWSKMSTEIQKQCDCKISVSTLLEDIATPEVKANGFDVADFMIE